MGFKILNVPPYMEGSAKPAIFMGLFIAFGGILFGYDTGLSPRNSVRVNLG